MHNRKTYTLETEGKPMTFEFGRLAQLAAGSVVARWGDTVILATSAASSKPREDLDFLPFRVDYEERQYAVGRIPGSFFRREGKPTDQATLACRLIDRPFRPLFPDGYRNDVQVVITVLSFDPDCPPDILGITAASMALTTSWIPMNDPVASARVGLVDGQLVLNPTKDQSEASDLDLIVAGTEDAVVMVEAGANGVGEDDIVEGIEMAHAEIRRLTALQREILEEMSAETGDPFLKTISAEVEASVRRTVGSRVRDFLFAEDKEDRETMRSGIFQEVHEDLGEEFPDDAWAIDQVLRQIEKEEMRRAIVDRGFRPDGRQPDEIRPISCEVGFLPRVHGSGLFNRGETQVLTVLALGSVGDRQMIDSLGHNDEHKRYLHHYNFPPYSTGESRFMRMPSRREIGHGALAERALLPVLPPEDEFPYTLRLVSEALASNGSTSMASVCASTLALMDAGVGIKAPVAGIAMGLIKEGEKYAVLSDIQGIEDHLGDMDFKVAGTTDGITALQMDIKIRGVDRNILSEALAQAKAGRNFILDKMLEVIPEPREEMSRHAPRIVTLKINPEKIRYVIGPGGKMINSIVEDFGVQVDIEDDGTVYVASDDAEGIDGALERIRGLTEDVEVGKVYKGTVKRIVDNLGAFVEILPNQDGLVHVSKLDTEFVDAPEDVVTVGDEILVKLVEVDKMDRINLSREACIKELGREAVEARETRAERKELTDEEKAERARKRRANSGGKGRNDRKRR